VFALGTSISSSTSAKLHARSQRDAADRRRDPLALDPASPAAIKLRGIDRLFTVAEDPHPLPIATGVIEGACRHLVEDRMGRTGARWFAAGAEAILRLRARRTSGDFDDYWAFHLAKEHERTHQSRYADKVVPNPLPARRAKLRLVK
jgi:hypothetical protein